MITDVWKYRGKSNKYGFRTEIAGYDALRLHTESRMLFTDADLSTPRCLTVTVLYHWR
uniref:Uncharacterized protein n=1 Tax=Escherichia coli TaxID=562 RepID=Q08JC3_ECOLX|nr:hypothetical protein [Escherichia coli]